MSNISSILNEQIRRVARREIRSNTQSVRRATAHYRHDIAALKRLVTDLARTVGYLKKQETKRSTKLGAVAIPDGTDIRFRADGLRSHRARLGLSAKDYGQLVGVSGLTIYAWEQGKSRPRRTQIAKIVAVRGIGIREALRRLGREGDEDKVGVAMAPSLAAPRIRVARGETAQEFITSLVSSGKATTTPQINDAWHESGRPGRADNTLSIMTRLGALTRTKVEGQRGSRYNVK